MTSRRFLLELGVEEMPSQYVFDIQDSLSALITAGLHDARLSLGEIGVSATPRRLTVDGTILARQEAEQETIRGPLISIAYDSKGDATPALLGFCRKVAMAPDTLGTLVEGTKTYVSAVRDKPQAGAAEILSQVMQSAFGAVMLPRSMRWGEQDWRFIRPLRWAALWLDQTLLPASFAGVATMPVTYGNRTDHPNPISYNGIDGYFDALKTGWVMLRAEDRKQRIFVEGNRLGESVGAQVDWDPALLDEVVNLVEWPTPFLGRFDAEFLTVPAPILVTAMKVHQRYFPLYNDNQELIAAFIGVRNGVGEHLDTVIQGNQKVLRARLADAQYFYQTDRKERLEDRLPALREVLFHAKLGTYGEKLHRVSQFLTQTHLWWQFTSEEYHTLERVIQLYKTDLLTHVVQEFPELQGEMGAIYAQREGEPDLLVEALRDQYRPQYHGDRIPKTKLGQWIGMADRVDTLVMALSHGLKPTGSEDPFGIRRAALGIGRILLEGGSFLHNRTIREIIKEMVQVANIGESRAVLEDAHALVVQRLTSYLETQYPLAMVRATLVTDLPWNTVPKRIGWLQELVQRDRWGDVVASYKRIDRVIPPGTRCTKPPGGPYALEIERTLAELAETLWEGSEAPAEWWEGALAISDVVNRLFEEVLVMDPDATVRDRRLELLAWVRAGLARYFDMGMVIAG